MRSNETKAKLLKALSEQDLLLGVIGLGYVGLPFCLATVAHGIKTIGFDIDPSKSAAIASGRSYLNHIPDDDLVKTVASGRFEVSEDFGRLMEPDILVICVPTPLTPQREPDLSYLIDTANRIMKCLRPGQMIILESTTYPGTTNEVLKPILERSGLEAHNDFFIAFSPEREDPGNKKFNTSVVPKVVGADTINEREVAETFYSIFIEKVFLVGNNKTAEMVKLTENIFRSVNIAMVNELKMISESMGIDIWEVIEAAKTKPFGFMPFYPGPGLGGHCIPIDPFYLSWKAKEYDITARFIELAGEINSAMPYRVVERLSQSLDYVLSKGVKDSKILIVGIAYKKNVDDMRESPALKIMEILDRRSAIVDYFDPLVPAIPATRAYEKFAGQKSKVWKLDIAAAYDAILILTDHDIIDYANLVRSANLIVDTRNACRKAGIESKKIYFA